MYFVKLCGRGKERDEEREDSTYTAAGAAHGLGDGKIQAGRVGKRGADAMDDLMELLENFQGAYAERDLARAEEWIREIFVEEEPVYFVSSSQFVVGFG